MLAGSGDDEQRSLRDRVAQLERQLEQGSASDRSEHD
jgi:hypothetical protein